MASAARGTLVGCPRLADPASVNRPSALLVESGDEDPPASSRLSGASGPMPPRGWPGGPQRPTKGRPSSVLRHSRGRPGTCALPSPQRAPSEAPQKPPLDELFVLARREGCL